MRTEGRSDARANRQRILSVARAAFAAEGPEVPIREIARRAGVGVATVYRHFATKQVLLLEAFADEMASCAEIVRRGLAADDPWAGFSYVVEHLMALHALDRGLAPVFTPANPEPAELAAERHRTFRDLIDLVDRAKGARRLRQDFVLEDVQLAVMANEGLRGATPELRLAASRRLSSFLLQAFQARPSSRAAAVVGSARTP